MLYIPNNDEVKDENVIHISSSCLTYLAHNIKQFTRVYRSYIYITKEKDFRILEALDIFADMLLEKRYKELFDDNVLIDFIDEEYFDTILNDDSVPF